MALKLSGIRNQAIGLLLAAVVLSGSETLAVIHLIMAGDWNSVLNNGTGAIVLGGVYALILLIMTMVLIAGTFGSFRKWRALAEGVGSHHFPDAPHQPDPALALHGGETLNLDRHRSGSLAGEIAGGFAAAILLGAFGAVGVIALLPAFKYTPFNLLAHPFALSASSSAPMPDPLDWFTLALPFVLGFALIAVAIIGSSSEVHQRITADDLGITVKRSAWRPQFIAWGDIHLALKYGIRDEDVAGAYTLLGREHALSFTIPPRRLPHATGKQLQQTAQHVYTGGYDAYVQDVQRLLSTIVVRSMAPIRTTRFFPQTTQRLQQRFPLQPITREQSLAAPIVTAPWQPLTSVPPAGTLVELTARPPVRATAARSIIWLIGLCVFIAVCALISNATTPYASPSMSPINEIFASPLTASIVIAILVVFLTPAAYFMAAATYTQRYVPVKADDAGIMTGSGNKATVVAWEEVRAWGIIPPPPGTRRAARYIIFTDSYLRLTWQEPHAAALWGRGVRGDRREAYRQRSEELHALIVAQTGQPLRDLGAPTVAHPLAV